MQGEEWLELLSRLRGHRLEVLRHLQGLGEAQASLQPVGEWSAKQQVAHMCHVEEAWLGWALEVHRSPGALVGDIPGGYSGFVRGVDAANGYPLRHWVTLLRASRAETLRRLSDAAIQPDALSATGTHRGMGEITVLQLLRSLYRHDRMHLEQMQGRPTSFLPGGRRP